MRHLAQECLTTQIDHTLHVTLTRVGGLWCSAGVDGYEAARYKKQSRALLQLEVIDLGVSRWCGKPGVG